ncbi:hypothetical protein NA57DRAFT_79637 [Rhizodiscina lignyota]|uniref:Uncharacterized protein n=1 Tax=Rhizodiscina lignyota TaxID=1504668 RepID=A0A9P4I8K5_9PEZI|nr:hypothetical protein NA57DRAFT_79637 [Rhizodiscina lignyota]
MEVNSPSAKPQRTKHQHSKSAANATPMKANNNNKEQLAGNLSSNRRPGNNRNRRNPQQGQQNQQVPAWDSATVTNPTDGYFDVNGNFVMSQPGQAWDSAEDSPRQNKANRKTPRKAKNQRPNNNDGYVSQGRSDVDRQNQNRRRNSPGAVNPANYAYAGPTFVNSPAGSAFPKPTAFSKSLPQLPSEEPNGSMQARLDQEPNGQDQSPDNDISPLASNANSIPPLPHREESPLDFFFKADRAEKARLASTSNGPTTPNGKLAHLPVQSEPPRANNWSEIYGNGFRHHSRTGSYDSQRGIFALELDGTSVQPNQTDMSPPRDLPRPSVQPQDSQKSLRDFLHSTASGGPSSPQSLPPINRNPSGYSSDSQNTSPFLRPHPAQIRSSSGPSTPVSYPQQHNPNNPLHYGNRNLSPLFKAAGNDRPLPRSSSSLRREVTSSPTSDSVELPAFSTPPTQPPSSVGRSKSYGHAHTTQQNTTVDVKSMEDDLRRMLKITAFGGGAGAGTAL